jgi:hypothetical protein
MAAFALGPAVLAIGLIAQMGWAASAWPFETARLSNFFLGAVLAAIAASALWVAATREWGALRASAPFPLLMLTAGAFTLDDGQTGAYLADGKKVAVLALGSLQDGELVLGAEDGTTVTGTTDGIASGTVNLQGEDYSFYAKRATGDTGWYLARTEVDGEPVAAGYILRADLTQRGAVRRSEKVIASPELDPADPTIKVKGVGKLEILPVAEFVTKEGGVS